MIGKSLILQWLAFFCVQKKVEKRFTSTTLKKR